MDLGNEHFSKRWEYQPSDIITKAVGEINPNGDYPIRMCASTSSSDLDEQNIKQKFDLRYFLGKDKSRGGNILIGKHTTTSVATPNLPIPPECIIGYPTGAVVAPNLIVDACLYKNRGNKQANDITKQIFDFIRLNPDTHPYKPSIEGLAILNKANPHIVEEVLIMNILLDHNAKNVETWVQARPFAEIAKAIATGEDWGEASNYAAEKQEPQARNDKYDPARRGRKNKNRKNRRGRSTECCGAHCTTLAKALQGIVDPEIALGTFVDHLMIDHNQEEIMAIYNAINHLRRI